MIEAKKEKVIGHKFDVLCEIFCLGQLQCDQGRRSQSRAGGRKVGEGHLY